MMQRMLVVDDEPATLLAFVKLFSGPEIAVDTAETLEDAMAMINARMYRVVVADLRLSGIEGEEGLEILKHLKADQSPAGFILITGLGNDDVRERARQLGADYFFEKPVFPSDLRNALRFLGLGTREELQADPSNGI